MSGVVMHLVVPVAAFFYERGSDVVPLRTTKEFKERVSNSSFLWVLQLYREGCGFCKLLEAEFEKVAADMKHIAYFGAIDTERHAQLASKVTQKYAFKVEGVPTVVTLTPGAKVATDYRGERTAKGLKAAAYRAMPSFVTELSASTLEAWLAKPSASESRKALLISEKPAVTPLLKAISSAYRGRVDLAQVTLDLKASSGKAFRERFGLERLPALIALKREADELEDARWLEEKFKGADFAALTWGPGEKPSFRGIEGWLMGYGRAPRKTPARARRRRGGSSEL